MVNHERLEEIKELALEISQKSSCQRLKVGAVIFSINSGIVDTIAYNKSIGCMPNCRHTYDELIYEHCTNTIHAELKAIASMAGKTKSTEFKNMMITHSPCLTCAKSIFIAGITQIFYLKNYGSNTKGIDFLKNSGLNVVKL